MRWIRSSTRWWLTVLTASGLAWSAGRSAPADEPADGWVDLSSLDAWKAPAKGWSTIGSVRLDAKDPKKLAAEGGSGVICNGPGGKSAQNLVTKQVFGDVEVHFDFYLSKESNSGVKFQEVYEIQLFDSQGAKTLKGSDLGGVYPRSELLPKYHHIDAGYPPLTNASLPPGEWQTLDASFFAPRFNDKGEKVADARISATINGKKVQDDLKVATPTGSAWKNKEKSTGALLLQGDHGPVAYRNIRARPIPGPRPADANSAH